MHKSLALAVICCFAVAGCETSRTWTAVTKVHPDAVADGADASNAYADKLHQVLKGDSVDHKVVTYRYHYTTRLREEAVTTRTAVVYRDTTDRKNPWWLMDDRLRKPVWLPGENLQKQVAFYIHGNAEVVDQKEFPAVQDHKEIAFNSVPSNGSDRSGVSRLAKFRAEPSAYYYQLTAVRQESDSQKEARIALFRSIHGTTFDPSSPLDRKKMELLKSEPLAHQPLAARSF